MLCYQSSDNMIMMVIVLSMFVTAVQFLQIQVKQLLMVREKEMSARQVECCLELSSPGFHRFWYFSCNRMGSMVLEYSTIESFVHSISLLLVITLVPGQGDCDSFD